MKQDTLISIRISRGVQERAKALSDAHILKPTFSQVIRRAIEIGLDAMEKDNEKAK